jgi:hypothetical protein
MTTKKRALVAVTSAVLLVGAAQIALNADFDYAIWIMMPGAAINLLTRGVHGTWNPYVTFVPSAMVWFAVIYGFLALVAKEFPGKTKPK